MEQSQKRKIVEKKEQYQQPLLIHETVYIYQMDFVSLFLIFQLFSPSFLYFSISLVC